MPRLPPVLALLLLASSLAGAAPPRRAPAPAEAWALILASETSRPAAEAKLKAMQDAQAFAFVKPAEGHPRIVESSSLPGLEPGLHVVVLGVCGLRRQALAAVARVRPEVGDAFAKRLTGAAALACPEPVDLKAKLPRDAQQLASAPFAGSPGLTLEAYSGRERSRMECVTRDLILRLVHEGRVLAEQTLEGRCEGFCTEKAQREGREEVKRLQEAIDRGEEDNSALDYNFFECQSFTPGFERIVEGLGNPLLLITDPKPWAHGTTKSPLRLVGVACGKLVVSEEFMGADAYERGFMTPNENLAGLRAQPAVSGDAGWKRFTLFVPDDEPEDAGAPAEKWFAGFEWKAERCDWDITHSRR
jgi:hypothetical protein